MIVPPPIKRAIRAWQLWREARQRRDRFARMLRVDPDLALAHSRLCRDRHLHAPSRADLQAMRERVHAELRREVNHG